MVGLILSSIYQEDWGHILELNSMMLFFASENTSILVKEKQKRLPLPYPRYLQNKIGPSFWIGHSVYCQC